MDEKTILTIMDKFNSSSIVEFELNENSSGLKLRKAGAFSAGRGVCGSGGERGNGERGGAHGEEARDAEGRAEDSGLRLVLPGAAAEGELITSPIVATFYASSDPDAKPFAPAGAKVKAGETLCILEAMKMMNHLEAEFDCEILEVKAKSGDLVEYGQALFRVERV
ncbi:MAG: acetyl-CoA carboxylase biotin carboxyl carrier protein subunit [Spirochaetaceae bacterium]|jgi:acetyl-CoA carboxylase biotin carboxyl carrier protein|nr:acetyl-CoA carboxylase biotin carboxyl carrier protein subunit [Spirochaetaceae bacterium]